MEKVAITKLDGLWTAGKVSLQPLLNSLPQVVRDTANYSTFAWTARSGLDLISATCLSNTLAGFSLFSILHTDFKALREDAKQTGQAIRSWKPSLAFVAGMGVAAPVVGLALSCRNVLLSATSLFGLTAPPSLGALFYAFQAPLAALSFFKLYQIDALKNDPESALQKIQDNPELYERILGQGVLEAKTVEELAPFINKASKDAFVQLAVALIFLQVWGLSQIAPKQTGLAQALSLLGASIALGKLIHDARAKQPLGLTSEEIEMAEIPALPRS